MKKMLLPYFLTIGGLGLLICGLYFIQAFEASQGVLQALPYVCVGLGCGIFGHGAGELINRVAMRNNPAAAKQLEIEQKDERNLMIANRAKAKAYDMMIIVFGALLLAFALMGIDVSVVLLLVFIYLFIVGYSAYYRFKYSKEM